MNLYLGCANRLAILVQKVLALPVAEVSISLAKLLVGPIFINISLATMFGSVMSSLESQNHIFIIYLVLTNKRILKDPDINGVCVIKLNFITGVPIYEGGHHI